MATVVPDLDWYTDLSHQKNLLPRCPFASVNRCPRYYQSLSLLRYAGTTTLDPAEDERLKRLWSGSDLWPAIDEQATSVSGVPDGGKAFDNFCPEVAFDRFGMFATLFADYTDDVHRGLEHDRLSNESAPPNDPRWRWMALVPMHYAECPLYSPLAHSAQAGSGSAQTKEEGILNVKPTFGGVTLNVNALFTRLRRWWRSRRIRKGVGP